VFSLDLYVTSVLQLLLSQKADNVHSKCKKYELYARFVPTFDSFSNDTCMVFGYV